MPRVLVVEDNHSIRMVIAHRLRALGIDVVEAENGQFALEMLDEYSDVDLILSDVMMPRMDGMKLCKELKSREKWKYTPFILLTAHGAQDAHIEAMECGADDFLVKPVNMEILIARLKNHLKKSEMLKTHLPTYVPPSEVFLEGFEVLEKIGDGTYGTVYRARQTKLEREVAIKVIRPEYLYNKDVLERFIREGKALCTVRHPGVAAVYDLQLEKGRPYIVMEYLSGGSLYLRLKNGALPVRETLQIVRSVALTLDQLHAKNIIHRDIKPGNILFDSEGRAVLVDFGISLITSSTRMTQEGFIVGTFPYMAPEQIQEFGRIDARTDFYNLGVVMFEMLTGDVPFYSENPQALFTKIIGEEPLSLSKIIPDIPPAVENVVNKLLKKNPDQRYQTGAELAADLDAILKSSSI